MRAPLLVGLFGILAGLAAFAQQQEPGLLERMETSRRQAIDAAQNPKKKYPMLENEMNRKKFAGSGGIKLGKDSYTENSFRFDQKVSPTGVATRSFFGIKNPWFGPKVFTSGSANLMSHGMLENVDRKFGAKEMPVAEFSLANKQAARRTDPVTGRQFYPDGAAQGAMDSLSQTNKDMTIDQVRELLNKNH